MISEARAPGPDETGPNRDSSAEINTFVENFSFIGMNRADGMPRILGVRTERDAVFMSGGDTGPDGIHFTRNTRVVRVDPDRGRALVTDVVRPPGSGRKGLVRSYVIDGFTSGEPYVSLARDDEFEDRAVFGFNAPAGGYIKVYDPSAAGGWDAAEASRLMHSGDMDTVQWQEFSVANKVDIALQVHGAHMPDEPQE